MLAYHLDHIMSFTALIGEREFIGSVPDGIRTNFYLSGGEVTGPKLSGKLRPVGGDWMLLRRDGIATLDIRATIETSDGALIYLTYTGQTDLGEEAYEARLRGSPLPSGGPIRTIPRFNTSHPDYLWLNRLFCIGIGQGGQGKVAYDVYAVL